jgi:alpha-tubulin suppressor-like RCC1 family protein
MKPNPFMKFILKLGCLAVLLLQAFTIQAANGNRIAAGPSYSLFLKSGGSLWGMGYNLALGNDPWITGPQQILSSNVTAIAAGGEHHLSVKSDGSLWAMGDNTAGQLGDGTTISTNMPEQIVSSGVTTVAAGGFTSFFLKSDGSLWAMGRNNSGELGDGTSDGGLYYADTPEQIVSSGVVAMAGGTWHSLFVKSDGSLWAMGDNSMGQLGNGTADLGAISYHNLPEKIVSSGVTAVAAGRYFSLFLKSDGSLWAMGYNDNGQLGDGTMHYTNAPEQIVSSGVTAIAAGEIHALFLKSDGSLWAMGNNGEGQLGYGSGLVLTNRPQRIVSGGVVAIAAGAMHSIFIKSDGSLWGMGDNHALGYERQPPLYLPIYTPTQIVAGVISPLPAITGFSESAGITPIRSNNPWQFTAHFTSIVSELWLHVQSTTTTNIEASWTDLPGNLHMTDVDGNWNLNTTNVPTGTNRYFRAVASAPGYFDSASRPEGPETVLGPPELPPIQLFLVSDGGTPVRSSNPWKFLAGYTNLVSGLQLRVQSTTTNDAGSWQDLRGIYYMTNNAGAWTLDKTDVPTGIRYFRVVASAPGFVDGVSPTYGPETVLPGFDLWGYFSYATSVPYSTHTPWSFAIGQPSQIPGMSLWVQSSKTPDDPNSWTYLPGGAQMTRYSDGTTWVLYTTNVPTGAAVSFRVIASAPDYVDLVSALLGPFDIGAPLPVHSTTVSTGGTYHLDDFLGIGGAFMSVVHVVGGAFVHLFPAGNTTTTAGAITLTADSGGSVDLKVDKGQVLNAAGVNVGSKATLLLSGTVDGNVSVGLVSHDGGSLVSHDGGSLVSHDGGSVARIAEIVAQGGGNLVSHDGGSIVAQGGGNILNLNGGAIVAQGGGNIVTPQSLETALSTLTQTSNEPSRPKDLTHPSFKVVRHGPDRGGTGPRTNVVAQPSFTGQMIINGNYDQFAAGTLAIAIAGTNTLNDGAQQYDQLVVSGQANLLDGSIAVGLFNPDDQTNLDNVFQPPDGATFDVVVASNIVVQTVQLQGWIWGDGLFFTGSVVTRTDGLQAVRLVATHYPPPIALQYSGPTLQLLYATNYTGYAVQRSLTLSLTNWTTISTGTNIVDIPRTNASAFFRLYHP